jgi:hypothetical protein
VPKPGHSIEEVLFEEKRREDALRDLGWQIVRWLWADIYRVGVIRDRVLRAFVRAAAIDHFASITRASRQTQLTQSAGE